MALQHQTLGTNIIPLHYTLTFEPGLPRFRFRGAAAIDISIAKATKTIALNAKELEISSAQVITGSEKLSASIAMNVPQQEVTITLPKLVQGNATVKLEFTGTHNDGMYGFYRSKYLLKGEEQFLLTTQFEAANARAAFPCFDEPAFKATFDVSMIVGKDMFTVSNMPIKAEKRVSSRTKLVTFQTSPKMSTYLLYLGVGQFKFISAKSGKVLIRVLATPDKIHLGKLALRYTKTFLQFFERYFKIPYPLPKVDIIAIPDFASGAMENWGAITFREIALLGDQDTSVVFKQNIAITIAHELAHQWFGNLVTMQWWDDLWLNESFATFMSYKAVHDAFPEWDVPLQYFEETIADALSADELESTHPINVKVNTPGEIDEIFDKISYDKGGSVLHMLESYVGEKAFREGLHLYLRTHAYGNATKDQLWGAIQQAHHDTTTSSMIKGWITQPGFPLVEVKRQGKRYLLSQTRFTLTRKKYTQKWTIPLNYSTADGKPGSLLLTKLRGTIFDSSPWPKLNYGQDGYYRVKYTPELLDALGEQIRQQKFYPLDVAGIENDLFALVLAGEYTIDYYLDFIEKHCLTVAYPASMSISLHLNSLLHVGYKRRWENTTKRVSTIFHHHLLGQIGWSRPKNEKNTTTMLRSLSISSLGIADDEKAIHYVHNLLEQIRSGKPVDSNLRGVVYSISAWRGDASLYNYLWKRYIREQVPEENRKLLRAGGMFRDKILIQKALAWSQSDNVRLQDSFVIPVTISGNPAASELLWQWLQQHWIQLMKRYSGGTHMLPTFVHCLSGLSTRKQLAEFQAFFRQKKHLRDDIKMVVRQVAERIRINVALVERNS